MYGLDVRAGPPAGERADIAGLAGLAALDREIRRTVPELPASLLLPWSDAPVVALDHDEPWQYGPVERDPTARGGRTVLPRAQLRELTALSGRLPGMHRIAVAHQLDPAGPVRDLLPTLRDGPRTCTDETARALVGPVPPHPVVRTALRALDGLRRGARSTAGLVLDPILLGVVGRTPPVHGEVCLWIPLTAWRW